MSWTTAFDGTAASVSTEYSLPNASTTLTPRTENGAFFLLLDTVNMAQGDEYELAIYEKGKAGGTQRLLYKKNLLGPQSSPIIATPTFSMGIGWDITLKKIAGTARSFDFTIGKY